jgi:hypothetical protein
MAYQINKTDGTIVATVADGQIDQLSTNISLIGKNYSGFGEALNENFIKILENFSSTARPTRPIRGQIWFDVSELKLKVYNGTEFVPVSSATISNTRPSTLAAGDLWFNDVDRQLYFFDGSNPILLGPVFSSTQGLSGLKVDSILDTLNQTRVITSLYNNGILIGIFAKDTFTPKNDIVGFSGSIQPGFNAGTLAGIKFNVTCTNSEQLGGALATNYVRKDTSNIINGQILITADTNSGGLVIGSASQANLYVNNSDIFLTNLASNRNIIFGVVRGVSQENAIVVNSALRQVNLYSGFLESQVNVGGDLIVAGNLTVEGNTTTLNTSDLTVEDKNIIIANVATPTDSTADGAGITIKGNTDKTIAYSDSEDRLDISEDINLAPGKLYYFGGERLISPRPGRPGEFDLGDAITGIPGVEEFGTLSRLEIGANPPTAQFRIETDSVSGKPRISTLSSNLDIELEPDGTGNVALIGSPRITGLETPVDGTDAANKEYVDDVLETRPLIFSMDLSDGKSNAYIITNILNGLGGAAPSYPIQGLAEDPTTAIARGRTPLYRNGITARILCTILSNSTTSLDLNPLLAAGKSTSPFLTNLSGGAAPAVTNYSIGPATVPPSPISTTRIIKVFRINSGSWSHVEDINVS